MMDAMRGAATLDEGIAAMEELEGTPEARSNRCSFCAVSLTCPSTQHGGFVLGVVAQVAAERERLAGKYFRNSKLCEFEKIKAMLCRSTGSLSLYAGDVWAAICDGTIATEVGKEIALRSLHMKVGAGNYTARHFYRTLVVGVLGLTVPGDELYVMGCGADDYLFDMVLKGRNVTGLSSFNGLMEEAVYDYVPLCCTGTLSYYICMAGDIEYMQSRREVKRPRLEAL